MLLKLIEHFSPHNTQLDKDTLQVFFFFLEENSQIIF